MKRYYQYRHNLFYCVGLLFCGSLLFSVSCQSPLSHPSESANAALSTFTLEEGFKIELISSEPFIVDPVAMEVDEQGQLYVVEMPGYPLDISGSGKVKILTDSDGDGKIDKSTLFADGLLFPTGIMRWKKGVLVTDPPNVWYLEDTDMDGRADVRDTVLTGFAVSNPSHIVNHPLYGLDNWIYIANDPAITSNVYVREFGDRGQEVTFAGMKGGPRLPQNASGRSLRFRPDQRQLELMSSKTQFGHSFDAWGHYLLVNNSNHAMQEVIHATYLRRNPDLLVSDATQSLSDHGNAAEVFPTTTKPELQMLTNVGVITSACGITAYSGGAFPEEYNKDVMFVAEPVSNLIHVDRLKHKGATFTASRIHEKKEFLTSTDAWFRPVYMYIGPDGALYVVDYYRRIIEHPEFMSDEVNNSGTLYDGSDKGRIYRISAVDAPPAAWMNGLDLGKLSNAELAEKLADDNIWWRRTAQRLLVDRSGDTGLEALVAITKDAQSPLGRLHALWTLEGIGKLKSQQIKDALRDEEPGVKENAIRLAELHLSDDPTLAAELITLKSDPDPKVKFQLLCTLGYLQSEEAEKARQEILFANVEDPWIQIAALSAPSSDKSTLLNAVLRNFRDDVPAYATLVRRLSAMAAASRDWKSITSLILQATNPAVDKNWQGAVLEGLAQGLKSKGNAGFDFRSERHMLVKTFFSHRSASVRSGSLRILEVIGMPDDNQTQLALRQAKQKAANTKLAPEERVEAVEFLALRDPAPFASFLKGLIVTGEALPVQAAAFNALSAIPDNTVSDFVLERWESLTPELRDVALNTFLKNTERMSLLLDAIEQDKIRRSSVGFNRSVRLMVQSDIPLRNRARALFTKSDDRRKQVVEEYQRSLDMAGDGAKGKVVFGKNCSTCHQIRGASGTAYGPDLGTVHNWPPADLLANILDPDRSISDGFDVWDLTLNNGKIVQGIISSETPNALTLRNAGGQETVISRTDIASLKTWDMSSMPTGLEAQITPQEMADLLAFLRKVE